MDIPVTVVKPSQLNWEAPKRCHLMLMTICSLPTSMRMLRYRNRYVLCLVEEFDSLVRVIMDI